MDLTSDCAGFSNNYTVADGLHEKCKFLTEKGKNVLEEEEFRSCNFWIGYKLYYYAQYSRCGRYRQRFMASKMDEQEENSYRFPVVVLIFNFRKPVVQGRVVTAIHNQKHVPWGSFFDEAIRELWGEIEEYGQVFHGQDWRDLRALMEEFNDVKKLSTSANGSLLMKIVEDDDHGTE